MILKLIITFIISTFVYSSSLIWAQQENTLPPTENNSDTLITNDGAGEYSVPSSEAVMETAPSRDALPPSDFSSDQPVSQVIDSLELRDMDINDVLKLLAAKSGLNIIAGKGIQGRVSIFLQNVEVFDALTIILKANDLAYVKDHDIIQIVTAAEYEQTFGQKFGVVTESIIIPLQSIKAVDAVALLSQVKSISGKMVADEQSNSIIIEEVPQKLKTLLEFIQTIDVPTKLKVYELEYVTAETLAAKLPEMLSPKIGSVKFDAPSNKLFVKDTVKKLAEIDAFVGQIDVTRLTKVFNLSYAKAEDVAKNLTSMITKDIGNVQFDARTNSIIVTDITPKIAEMYRVILAMDQQQKQVLIETRIVQIDLNDQYKMGINWETLIPRLGGYKLSASGLRLTNDFSLPSTTSPVSTATLGTFSDDNYKLVLQAIANLGNSRTLSNPRIAVVNNQEAKILVGSTQPYVTSTTTTPASGPTTTAESVNFIDVGIRLLVTPTIHEDGFITMKLKPEVSSADQTIKTGENNTIPIKQTSEVDTTIRVKDGVTIMIGGLIKEVAQNKKNKIPVLGDIPLLGKAFRSEERGTTTTEIVIFLTPHIITGDVPSNAAAYDAGFALKTSENYFNPLPKDTNTTPIE